MQTKTLKVTRRGKREVFDVLFSGNWECVPITHSIFRKMQERIYFSCQICMHSSTIQGHFILKDPCVRSKYSISILMSWATKPI